MSLIDVLDLPQLYTKPSASALLDALVSLTLSPQSWEARAIEGKDDGTQRNVPRAAGVQINPQGVTRYLTSIVGSSLDWMDDEQTKENIWHEASLRLSERSGRTGMGTFSRLFRIPSSTDSFEIRIHEPAMTGDDLGHKTWAASYLLAKRLHRIELTRTDSSSRIQVLELGAGTGLVGLAMAGLGADVVLTDMASIHLNLARNVKDNSKVVSLRGGMARSGVLDWTDPESLQLSSPITTNTEAPAIILDNKFPLILAADSLYSSDHPKWLVNTIATWLADDESAKVVVEFPLRDPYLPEVADFRRRMEKIGLYILEEGEEEGFDDWGSNSAEEDEDGRAIVTCWFSIWGRIPPGKTAT